MADDEYDDEYALELDLELEDEDEEAFLAAWEAVDRDAAAVLAEACRDVMREAPPEDALRRSAAQIRDGVALERWPFAYFVSACDWQVEYPDDDPVLWLDAAASTISPLNDPGTDPEFQAAVMALDHADWLAIVIGLVRRGVGSELDAMAVQHHLVTMPEIEYEVEDPEGDVVSLEFAITVLTPLWQAIGALDEDERLTELGRWGLPRALRLVWTRDTPDLTDGVGRTTE